MEFLTTVFQRFGYSKAILTDNGPQFLSIGWDAALRKWQAMHWTTPVHHHPRANPVERRNQQLKKGLRVQREGPECEKRTDKLNPVLFNLQYRKNKATGYSPAKALFKHELHRPGEWRDPPQAEPKDSQTRQDKTRYTLMSSDIRNEGIINLMPEYLLMLDQETW